MPEQPPISVVAMMRGRLPEGYVLVSKADLGAVLNRRVAHAHLRPGVWDDDNCPEKAGKPCVECAAETRLRTALEVDARTEPMRPEDIPPELKAIVDERAGRVHSAEGSVMSCLAEVLTAARRLWWIETFGGSEETQARIEAPVRATVAIEIRALRTEMGLSPDSPEDLAFGRGLEIAARVAEGAYDDGSQP